MSLYALAEKLLIAAALLVSLWVAWGALLPGRRAAVLRHLGLKRTPAERQAGCDTGCDTGCGSCTGCSPESSSATGSEKPIRFETPRP